MKKKPLFLRLKHDVVDLATYMLYRIAFNSQSKLLCKIGLHKTIPTSSGDKCARCGMWYGTLPDNRKI